MMQWENRSRAQTHIASERTSKALKRRQYRYSQKTPTRTTNLRAPLRSRRSVQRKPVVLLPVRAVPGRDLHSRGLPRCLSEIL
jgi:hypothetical protein